MAEEKKLEGDGLSRREVMARSAWAGLGVTAGLVGAGGLEKLWGEIAPRVDESSPRIFGASVEKLPPIDNRYPVMPSWGTELKQLAPNVYAYQQEGGTGHLNAGISNAGLFVGEDSLLVFDALGYPVQSKAFIAAAKKAGGGKPITQSYKQPPSRRSCGRQSILSSSADFQPSLLPARSAESDSGYSGVVAESGRPRGRHRSAQARAADRDV